MANTYDVSFGEFSLVQGGPIYRAQSWLRMATPERGSTVPCALLSIAVTWAPLLLLSIVEGQMVEGTGIPFLFDFAVNIRFLVALPLLIVAEAVIDPRIRHAVQYFISSGLVTPEQLPAYASVVSGTKRLCDSKLAAAVLVVCALAPVFRLTDGAVIGGAVKSWQACPSGADTSMAGFWFQFISLPLYRLLLFRWAWLLIVWTIFLKRVANLPLSCVPTHPDGAAGLGFLAETQLFFAPVTLASSATVASGMANLIVYHNASLASLKHLIIGFCLFSVALACIPLLAVSARLFQVKLKGLLTYGALGSSYVQRFAVKWVNGRDPPDDSLLGSSDIQSLADLNNSFAVVRDMRIVLINKQILVGLALPALAPMLILLLVVTPVDKVIGGILKFLS